MLQILNKRYYFFILLVTCFSCEKNSFTVSQRDSPQADAFVKFCFFPATTNTIPVQGYVNGIRVTSSLTFPISFPGGGFNMGGSSNADYLTMKPGANKIEFYTPYAGTDIPLSKFLETTQTVEAGKKYTIFFADTAANATAFTVSDDTNTPDSGFARVKFVNVLPNGGAVDLFKGPTAAAATLLIANINYKAASDYVNIQAGVDSFFIRTVNQPTSVPIARRGFTFSNQRIYTILGRGYIGGSGTNRIPNVSAIVNQ